MKLSEIARLIEGELQGNDLEIEGVSDLEYQRKGTLCYADNRKNYEFLQKTDIAAIVVGRDLDFSGKPIIRVGHPKLAFTKVLQLFNPFTPPQSGISPMAFIETDVKIGKSVTVMQFSSVMEGSEIGDGTVIYPNVFIGRQVKVGKNCIFRSGVRINDGTIIGDRVMIDQNSVVGGEGFGYIQKDGENIKVPQIGRVIIGNDVELGSLVAIDRATIGDTIIEDDVKIDNFVQISHNVKIGAHTVIISHCAIGGSVTFGKNCMVAGRVGVIDHCKAGDNVVILAGSWIKDKTIESGKILLGSPARDYMEEKRIYISQSSLPGLIKKVDELEKKLKDK